MKKICIAFMMIGLTFSAFAQKKELIEDKEAIHERAIAEIEAALTPPEGSIYLFASERSIKGEYTYDITIREKGDVATVFSVGNNNGTVENQNRLKDFMMTFDFNFKMPKGKYYKFRYTFKFD